MNARLPHHTIEADAASAPCDPRALELASACATTGRCRCCCAVAKAMKAAGHRRSAAAATAWGLAAMLSACSTTVQFTSEPSGAKVVYQGATLGTTPFDMPVTDQFGWFSTYAFTATFDGYKPQTVEVRERSPLDAQGVLPRKIHFTLSR